MTTTGTTPKTLATSVATPLVRVFRVFAALAVLAVFSQFVTAGQLFGKSRPEAAHAAGAIVLHVVSGVAAIAAVVLWRKGAYGVGTAVLAVVVFALGFVQAAVGGFRTLYVHVPGAMLLTAGTVWLLVIAVRRRSA